VSDRIGVQLPVQEIYLGLTSHSGELSLAIPPWVVAMSTRQWAVKLCGWGLKAGCSCFEVGKTVPTLV